MPSGQPGEAIAQDELDGEPSNGSAPPKRGGLTTRPVWRPRRRNAPGVGRVNGASGKTNGLVNGVGRTNGLVNGTGRTNGLATGIGYVNGVRLRMNSHAVVASSDVRRTVVFISISVVVMFLASFLLGVQEPPVSRFAVDGDFGEWAPVPKYADAVDNVPAHVDLVTFAYHEEDGRLFVYGRTRAPMFPGNETSSVYVLIDDPSADGYVVQGFDVDYIAEAWGWNGLLRQSALRAWSGDPDRDNATSLRNLGSFAAVSAGPEFELMLADTSLDLSPLLDLRFTIVSRFDDAVDATVNVGRRAGALEVLQRPLTRLVSSTSPVLELRFRAYLSDIQVRGLVFDRAGGGTWIVPTSPFTVVAGPERVELVSVDPSGLPPGTFVTMRLRDVDAVLPGTTDAVPATITGPGARAYVQTAPAGFVVDGLFDEWTGATSDPDEGVPSTVEIRESGYAVRSDAFFYVGMEGEILSGALLPERRPIPPPPANGSAASPPRPLLREAGEDVLRIYVDTDEGDTTGFAVGGIVADKLLEVHGRAGRITSRALFAWNDVTWRWDPRNGPFDVAFEGSRLEASTGLAFLGSLNNSRTVFAMSDWAFRRDVTDIPAPAMSPSLRLTPSPLHALPLPDEVDATPLTSLVPPTIDGNCATFAGEYAGGTMASNPAITFIVGRVDATQFVYVCIRVTADTARSGNDWGEVIFDTLHDGGATPQVDDKLFWVFGCSGGGCDTTVSAWQGDGAVWDTICPTCDPGNAGASRLSTFMWYEFRVRYTDVWDTLLPAPGQIAGFAIIAYDFNVGVLHTWGGPAVDENIPDSWGHLYYPIVIPEFPLPFLGVFPAVLIPFLRRRRGKAAA